MPLAIVRPSDWEAPLFLHVLGAMVLVGSLAVVALALLLAWRRDDADAAALNGLAYRTLFFATLPAYIAMRIGAQWVQSEEGLDDGDDPAWIGVGYVTSDLGALLLVVSLVLGGLALRGRRRDGRFPRIVAVLAVVLLAAYVVAIWAMTTKPT